MSIAGAEHVAARGIGAWGRYDVAGCAEEPAGVYFHCGWQLGRLPGI